MTMTMELQELSVEQRLMRQTARDYVDRVVIPFIRANREREWLFEPDERLPKEILEEADAAGLRSLAVPEKYGGGGGGPDAPARRACDRWLCPRNTAGWCWTRRPRRRRSPSSPPRSPAATPGSPTSWPRTGKSRCSSVPWLPRTSRTSGSRATWRIR